MPAYDAVRADLAAQFEGYVFGNPAATPTAILKLVDNPVPPLRLALGSNTLPQIVATYEARLASWRSWESVSIETQG